MLFIAMIPIIEERIEPITANGILSLSQSSYLFTEDFNRFTSSFSSIKISVMMSAVTQPTIWLPFPEQRVRYFVINPFSHPLGFTVIYQAIIYNDLI